MNYTKILIKQDGAYALPEVPEYPTCKICGDIGRAMPTLGEPDGIDCECTKQALDNAVKFREPLLPLVQQLPGYKVGETYTCPEGFEIVIENGYATLKNIK
jgi:hypothetical protein